jgi:hypothetical protein
VEPQAAAAADDPPGDGEDPQPDPSGFPAAGRAVKASICIQASSSQASAVISDQIWFCANPCSGMLRSPVSLAQRPVLAAGAAAVAELQVRKLAAFGCWWQSR